MCQERSLFMQSQKGKTDRKTGVRRQDSLEEDVTFNSLRESIHSVVDTIEGQFHCLNTRSCDDLR